MLPTEDEEPYHTDNNDLADRKIEATPDLGNPTNDLNAFSDHMHVDGEVDGGNGGMTEQTPRESLEVEHTATNNTHTNTQRDTEEVLPSKAVNVTINRCPSENYSPEYPDDGEGGETVQDSDDEVDQLNDDGQSGDEGELNDDGQLGDEGQLNDDGQSGEEGQLIDNVTFTDNAKFNDDVKFNGDALPDKPATVHASLPALVRRPIVRGSRQDGKIGVMSRRGYLVCRAMDIEAHPVVVSATYTLRVISVVIVMLTSPHRFSSWGDNVASVVSQRSPKNVA